MSKVVKSVKKQLKYGVPYVVVFLQARQTTHNKQTQALLVKTRIVDNNREFTKGNKREAQLQFL